MEGEFVGVFEAPAGDECRSAVLLVGGSEGGLTPEHLRIARSLADHGIGALAVAYFGLPGLPAHLAGIRLEYFADALTWLADQTGLSAESMVVWGASRGSEAALLTATCFPDLVHNAVALVPGNVVLAGWPDPSLPAWTVAGSPLPFVEHFGPDATDQSALIPVERIVGRVLFAGAGADEKWPSAEMARALVSRRGGLRRGDVLVDSPHARHGLAWVRSDTVTGSPNDTTTAASVNLWAGILRFLESISRCEERRVTM